LYFSCIVDKNSKITSQFQLEAGSLALSPNLSRELSDFDQIWQADVRFNSHDGILTKKNEILQIQDGGRTPY